jgi:hypothetical protein
VDTAGNLRNWNAYGCRRNSVAYALCQTHDNGFILMGSMDSIYTGIRGQMLLKTDASGHQQWINQLTNGAWQDIGKDILQAPDGSYLIAGSADGGGYGSSSMHIMHYDSTGHYLSGPSVGGNSTQCGNSVAMAGNGTVVFAGATTSFGNGNNDFFLVRFKNDSIGQNPAVALHNFPDSLTATGIHEHAGAAVSVRIFPNPMTTETGIYVQASAPGHYFISLYDATGHCLRSHIPLQATGHNLSEVHLPREGLCSGIYFYEINQDTEISYCGKLIVE